MAKRRRVLAQSCSPSRAVEWLVCGGCWSAYPWPALTDGDIRVRERNLRSVHIAVRNDRRTGVHGMNGTLPARHRDLAAECGHQYRVLPWLVARRRTRVLARRRI